MHGGGRWWGWLTSWQWWCVCQWCKGMQGKTFISDSFVVVLFFFMMFFFHYVSLCSNGSISLYLFSIFFFQWSERQWWVLVVLNLFWDARSVVCFPHVNHRNITPFFSPTFLLGSWNFNLPSSQSLQEIFSPATTAMRSEKKRCNLHTTSMRQWWMQSTPKIMGCKVINFSGATTESHSGWQSLSSLLIADCDWDPH